MAEIKVRFAPSPTGLLQLGNARTALVNWLFARKAGGRTLLRLDDTDRDRSEARFAEALEEDLAWLGLDWDERARQSDRLERYDAAVARLKAAGRLYPCYETAEELEIKRRLRLSQGKPPIYDRAALDLGAEERAKLEAEGRRPHWRFKLVGGEILWRDLVRGEQRFEAANLSDPVLLREDGRPLYTLSSVVDDIELGVSHVLRGEDHVANTAVQVQLFEALTESGGDAVPIFGHLALLTDASGEKLSKRLGSLSLKALREEEGLEPLAVASYLARLGTPDPAEPVTGIHQLLANFEIARFGRAAPKVDLEDLNRVNARTLHCLPFEAVASRLAHLPGIDEGFWLAVRENLTRLEEAEEWFAICRGAVDPVIEETDYLAEAAKHLPPEPWDGETWGQWTRAVKEASGRKGKALFLPLRLALTGRAQGPELARLLPLIGREKALSRLAGCRS